MNQLEKSRTQKIVALHNEIYSHLQMSLEKGIELGGLLAEQKQSLKHGEFTPWVKANLPFTDRTARNYMRLYKERDRLENGNISDLREAYKLLRGPRTLQVEGNNLETLIAGRDKALKRAQEAAVLLLDYEAKIGEASSAEQKFNALYAEAQQCSEQLEQLRKQKLNLGTETKEDWINSVKWLADICVVADRNEAATLKLFTALYGKTTFKAMCGEDLYQQLLDAKNRATQWLHGQMAA